MLANRNNFIPGGFQFLQPETGWQAPAWLSFDTLVRTVIEHRKANPALAAQHKWAMDYDSVANEVDNYNAQICAAHGWVQFIAGGSSDPFREASRSPLKARLAAAAGGAVRVAAGIRTLLDWLGKGGKPVKKELADARAVCCSKCPMNKPGDWKSYFTEPVAKQIGLQLEMKNSMKLETSKDKDLHICVACDCPLKLKVWTPLQHIIDNMSPETNSRLHVQCWIRWEG